MLKDFFGLGEHQEKATYCFGYKLKLTGNKDDIVWNKPEAIADAGIKIYSIHWFVPHYTHSIPQQGIISKNILGKTAVELRYFG